MDSYLHSNFSLHDLLENQIPKEMRGLEESSSKLEHVAAYCENEYGKAIDKKAAFEQTKQLTIQSLASVAYQVNQLSSALLRSLDLEMESVVSKINEVNNNAHELDIQREKAARQEIGKLTMNKTIRRENIVKSLMKEPPKRHKFVPIDFSALDHIGHGIPDRENNYNAVTVNRTNSILSGSDTVSSHGGQHTYDFLLPRGQSTLTRKSIRSDMSTVYRTPQVPSVYNERYSTANTSAVYSGSGSGNYSSSTLRTPSGPSSQLGSISQYRLSTESTEALPAPPNVLMNPIDEPLPPPPFDESYYGHNPDIETPTNDYVPRNYIEKARALYDYEAEKEDELNLREDCIVYVVAKNDDGWYEGVVNGVTGLFPSNYVQKIS